MNDDELSQEVDMKMDNEKMTEEKKKYTGRGGYHGGGRKAKGPEPKTCTMSIVCTASEKEKIKENAAKEGVTISEYCIKKILC
ncbi:MAG: hypothetical protein IJR80_04635 [Treponema sp.]|nr:hypothetical protein [Treponema sp.]